MGASSSVPASRQDEFIPRAELGGGVLSGCSPVCFDAGYFDQERSGSLRKVMQHCCFQSEREGALELVEQQKVIGEEESKSDVGSPSSSRRPRKGLQRRYLVVSPHVDQQFEDCYDLFEQVGEGSFGNVYKASSTSRAASQATPRQLAVKIFSIRKQTPEMLDPAEPEKAPDEDAKKRLMSFSAECMLLSQLEHPHIVRMHECFQTETHLHLVLEMCHGGELYACLVRRIKEAGSGGLPEPDVQNLFRQMLWAISYLHANQIVHRDLKPENYLLVGADGAGEADVLKLCDFGTAMQLTEKRPRSMVNIGTLSYTAPEVYAHRGADLPADAWSLGVVLYVMLTGTNPFRGSKTATKQDTVKKIKTGVFATQRPSWLKVTEQGQDLVKKLLVLSEHHRLTGPEALRHPWLADVRRGDSFDDEEAETLAVSALRFMCQMPRLEEPQRYALAACTMAATEADVEQPSAWRRLFILLDQDADGSLSHEELCAGLRKLAGVPRSEVSDAEIMSAALAADFDGSGALEWNEWLAIALLSVENLSETLIVDVAHRLLDRQMPESIVEPVKSGVGESMQVAKSIRKFANQLRRGDEDDEALRVEDLRLVLLSCQGRPV
eukprot:TRINITY_DN15228_c1_g1_i1.p1 TRINITY_DN15228_c1_g1~~TRINITY_DN15228_c1_g1_i1.p1  ORF type:complete len:623 (-),score=119.13 TRINITY_DN15228_c1_g1_i1:94-1920(-)